MHFLPDVYVTCDVCHGQRYNRETLEVKFKGQSIADVLDMTVEDAAEFFKAVPPIRDKMRDAGGGRPRLHQGRPAGDDPERRRGPAGEAGQGAEPARDRADPLHPRRADHRASISRTCGSCSRCSMRWWSRATRVVVIEHNLEVIKTADWVLDLGPEGGDKGGEIVAEGTPEQVAKEPRSYTGGYLKELLAKSERAPLPVTRTRKKRAAADRERGAADRWAATEALLGPERNPEPAENDAIERRVEESTSASASSSPLRAPLMIFFLSSSPARRLGATAWPAPGADCSRRSTSPSSPPAS